jgi:hypothetical protein
MNELKRSRVVDGKIRTVTNAQYVCFSSSSNSRMTRLSVFVERGCRLVLDKPSSSLLKNPLVRELS